MSACAKQVFSNIGQDKFNRISAKAASYGVAISGPKGSASKDGVSITWDYDVFSGTLQITCTDSPFYLSCGIINSEIHTVVDDC